MSRPVSIEVFRSLDEIESVHAFWSSSAGPRDSDINIISNEQRTSGDVLRPHVLGVYRDGSLETLLIGRVVRRRLPLHVGYLTVPSPVVETIAFPYGALRGDDSAQNCEILVGEVMQALKRGEADLALFEHVRVDSHLFRCGKRAVGFLLGDRFSPVRPHRRRELPASVDDLRASLSASERRRFRQIARKLATEFSSEVTLVTLGDRADLDRIVRDVGEVARKTWQHKLGQGGFNTGEALKARLRTEAEMGALRVYLLYLGGNPAAFWVGASYQQTFYSDFTGYDPAYARYSVGTYLLSQILEDLCRIGITAIDFGFTDDEYKRRFGNVEWMETNLHLFPPTLFGVQLSGMRAATALISNASRAMLQHTGLTQRVKSAWRKAARRNESDGTGSITQTDLARESD
jgi:hypothetical protein